MNQSALLSKPFHIPKRVNRRTDTTIRSAIDEIQNLLFDPQAPCKIFPLLLNHMLDITKSDYGVIYTGDKEGIAPILSGQKTRLYCNWGRNIEEFVCTHTISRWIEQDILPMRPVFFNDPIPKSHANALLHPERIASVIFFPIISRQQLQGICILAKKEGSFNGDIVGRLMPLLGSVVCALQSADSVKSKMLNLTHKISDDKFLNTLLSTSPLATLIIDESKKVVVSNPAAHYIFCPNSNLNNSNTSNSSISNSNKPFYRNTLDGGSIYDFIPHFDDLFQWSNQRHRYGEEAVHAGLQVWEDQTAYKADRSQFTTNITVFRYTLGQQCYTALQIQDVTAMRASAEDFQKASQQLNALTHLVPVGIIQIDINWNCIYANDKWYEFSGLSNDETQKTGWVNAIHSDDVTQLLENLHEHLDAGKEYQAEFRLVSPLGQIRWVDFNTQVLYDEHGSIQGFLATIADITERLAHQEKLRQVAEYDSLTGLANRYLFQDRLQQAFHTSSRDKQDVVVFFIDLDGFKDINDSLGHDAGDQLLREVADRLLNTLRRSDTIARFGGDEFIVLLSPTEKPDNVPGVATKIIEIIGTPYVLDNQEVYITASLGIASGNNSNNSPDQILKQADAALYLAKEEGKNNFQLFNSDLDKKAKYRIHLMNLFRSAISKERLSLCYQAQARVDNNQVTGFEVLLRFQDEKNNIILPNEFIPLLEESGMIIEIGEWVINEACKQLQYWQHHDLYPKDGTLSINVSPKQLLDENFVSVILNACNRYQINPQQLIIELTETVIIDNPQKVQEALMALKDIGVKLALDDFGTGYSSLSYLQRYPFDHLKIDKSFVSDLMTDKNDKKITKAIIALSKSLGLKIIAEGVVDKDSLNILKSYGADYYQGYYLSEPQSPKNAIEILKAAEDISSL